MDEEMRMQYNRGYIAEALSNPEYFKGSIYISNEELAMQYQRGYIDGFKEGKATFEPKTGHWIGIDEEPHEDYECDKCGYVVSTYTANIKPHTEYKFCPSCGAKMVEEQERSDKE